MPWLDSYGNELFVNHIFIMSASIIFPQANRIRDLLKKGDDAASEMSAESATSDSGRGGSEEDVHSNRGHPLSDTGTHNYLY